MVGIFSGRRIRGQGAVRTLLKVLKNCENKNFYPWQANFLGIVPPSLASFLQQTTLHNILHFASFTSQYNVHTNVESIVERNSIKRW